MSHIESTPAYIYSTEYELETDLKGETKNLSEHSRFKLLRRNILRWTLEGTDEQSVQRLATGPAITRIYRPRASFSQGSYWVSLEE